MNLFELHWDALPPAQKEIWPLLAPSVEMGLVLYGGTAAALRLGHRTSVDFDFFTEKPLDREALARAFEFLGRSRVIQDEKDALSVLAPGVSAAVKLSFFGSIGIGRAGVPERTADGVLEVASLLDLLATKLKAMRQRIEAKDYRDVAAMLSSGVGLEDGMAAAAAMYGASFQPSEAMKALTYFEGGDLGDLSAADRAILIEAVVRLRKIPIAGLMSRSLSA